MRQRATNYAPAPTSQDYQQKAGWYPADPGFAPQAQPFYAGGQAPAMMISSYPTQPIAFQPFQAAYPQQVPYQQYPTGSIQYFQEENPAQMMVFRPTVPQPAPPVAPPVAAPRSYQPTSSPATRTASQSQIVVQQVAPPPPPPPPPPPVPQQPRIEKAQIQQQQQATLDVSTQPRFDNLKYPIPGCFSVIQRGNLPGIDIVPV